MLNYRKPCYQCFFQKILYILHFLTVTASVHLIHSYLLKGFSKSPMHFWIDKRSQACGFNGRHGVPASLASGRRRGNKPMVTPVHRFQSTENGPMQHLRRQHQSSSHVRHSSPQSCITSTVNNATVDGSMMTITSHTGEVDSGTCMEANGDTHLDPGQNSRLVRIGGLIKYGIWASFGLVTVSVAVTKFFINNQGTFEIVMLSTLGMLTVGLLGSCILSVCRTKSESEFIDVTPQTHRPEMEIQEVISHREETILPVESPQIIPRQTILGSNENATAQAELPPPPYHIAVLLPKTKEKPSEDLPPPSYENALR